MTHKLSYFARPDESAGSRFGLICGLGAYLAWGFIPLYFKMVTTVPAVDVVSHRVVWSSLFLAVLLTLQGKWNEVIAAVRSPRTILCLVGSTIVIASNWLLFIWSVNNNHVMQSSLGYFINPLINVLLGVTLLKERMRPIQIACMALACVAVGLLTKELGLPWIALALAVSFGFYGFFRKIAHVNPLAGLAIETGILLPIAVGWLLFGTHDTASHVPRIFGLLILAGPITAIPLILFAAAARRLRLTTLGFLQYLSPTCQFLLAVFAFGEPFREVQRNSFALIWIALFLFTVDSIVYARKTRAARPLAAVVIEI